MSTIYRGTFFFIEDDDAAESFKSSAEEQGFNVTGLARNNYYVVYVE